jgi:malonyl-CoA/methylmalonyl-CoA synthetase
MAANLFETISQRADAPARPFAHLGDGRSISYGEMIDWTGRYANALSSLGIGLGDRVAVQTGKHFECILLHLACLRTGAIYLPLNPAYTPAEVGYFVGDAEPKLFVRDAAGASDPAGLPAGCRVETIGSGGEGSLPARAKTASPRFQTVAVAGDDLAAILYTSGTTGRSKGAMITHENLRSNALALVEAWRFTASDVLLHALPIFHTHGLFVATNTVLLSGASMIFHEKFEVGALIADMARATVLMGVPTFYSRLLADDRFTREAARPMRLFISGSAPLSAEVHRQFQARTGHAILERYGMTETNMITSNPYDGERRPGTVGFPLPGLEVRVADPETGRPLAQGEVGVIELKGPNVFKGYWRMPEKTAEDFRADGFFITGDLSFVDPDGYFTISGRAKDLIISGGFNVYPAEIENALDALPEIAESAVIGLPHEDLGEAVTAIIVARKGAAIDEAALRAALEPVLARFKLPKRIVTRAELPRNAMGKVQKKALREEYSGLYRA